MVDTVTLSEALAGLSDNFWRFTAAGNIFATGQTLRAGYAAAA
jgi:hypothetical protein